MRKAFEKMDPFWLKTIHNEFLAVSVRQGESIQAKINNQDNPNGQSLLVWRLSPFGIEVVNVGDTSYAVGEQVTLELCLGSQTVTRTGTIVRTDGQTPKGPLLGITFSPSESRSHAKSESATRKLTRWRTHHMFFPTGHANNPARFNDKVFFKVIDISRNGATISTSMRNKFLMPGLILSGHISFPNLGNAEYTGEIISIHVKENKGKNIQILGIKLLKLKSTTVKAIGRYILNFGHHATQMPSPAILKREGYGVIELGSAVEWDYVSTEDEYQSVLKLRSDAFQGVEGLGVVSNAEEMGDIFDSRARIVIARFRGKIIGTVRICFHGPTDLFEEEQYITFPADFPPRDQVVEASRAATHPDFRGADLFMNMMRFTMLTTLQAGRRWLVQSTYGALVPIYKRIGFKEMGLKVPHPVFPGENLTLLMADAHSVATARSGNPFLYQSLVPHIELFLQSSAFDDLTWLEKSRLKLYKHTAPAYRLYLRTQSFKRQIKRKLKQSRR